MVSLADRRDILCLKFAKKSLKVENFGHLLPISTKGHKMQTRHCDIFKINNGYSKRYMKSAIPSMQRILNRDRRASESIKTNIKSHCVTNKLCLLGYIVVTINFIIIIIITLDWRQP